MAGPKPFAFEDSDAVRENVPLLVGLSGASGSGKTYTALRLAHGIQSVVGGDIYFVDTENRRGLHYAGAKSPAGQVFKFRHVPFAAPYQSLKYRDALRYCVGKGAGVIIVDSMSHEHDSDGGMIDYHEREVDRLSRGEDNRREAVNMLAWSKPKAERRELLKEIQKLQTNVIFCYRAKTVAKPVKVNGKTEVVQQGFMPIGGDEFVFEMTLNALFYPHANGVPTWKTDFVGERMMIKLPDQFRALEEMTVPFDEAMGVRLAKWARGGAPAKVDGDAGDGDKKTTRNAPRASNRDQASAEGRPCQEDGAQANPPLDTTGTAQAKAEAPPEESGGPGRPEAHMEGQAADPSAEAPTAEEPAGEPAPAGDGQPPAPEVQDAQQQQDAPQAAEPAQEPLATSETPAEPLGADFAGFAQAVAGAQDWPQILAALRTLIATDEWKTATAERQVIVRRIAFTRLTQLMANGLRFDFLADAHAFRCYLEYEKDPDAIEGNHRAFKVGKLYPQLAEGARAGIDKAAEGRILALRPQAPAGTEEFE